MPVKVMEMVWQWLTNPDAANEATTLQTMQKMMRREAAATARLARTMKRERRDEKGREITFQKTDRRGLSNLSRQNQS